MHLDMLSLVGLYSFIQGLDPGSHRCLPVLYHTVIILALALCETHVSKELTTEQTIQDGQDRPCDVGRQERDHCGWVS